MSLSAPRLNREIFLCVLYRVTVGGNALLLRRMSPVVPGGKSVTSNGTRTTDRRAQRGLSTSNSAVRVTSVPAGGGGGRGLDSLYVNLRIGTPALSSPAIDFGMRCRRSARTFKRGTTIALETSLMPSRSIPVVWLTRGDRPREFVLRIDVTSFLLENCLTSQTLQTLWRRALAFSETPNALEQSVNLGKCKKKKHQMRKNFSDINIAKILRKSISHF